MSESCKKILMLMPEYLDGVLDDRSRKIVEQHLAQCAECRSAMDQQKTWLSYRTDFLAKNARAAASPDFNQRIMSAIQQEALQKQIETAGPKIPIYRRPYFWRRLTSTAAAIMLLFAAVQIFQGIIHTNQYSTGEMDGIFSSDRENITEAAIATTGKYSGSSNASDNMAGHTADWQLYNGALSDLPAAGCLFKNQESAVDQTTGSPETRKPTQASASETVDGRGSAIFDILSQANSMLILTSSEPAEQALILAEYPDNQIQKQVESIKNSLNTCATPIRIEIIKSDDLLVRIDQLDPELFEKLSIQPKAGSSWIFLLIGE